MTSYNFFCHLPNTFASTGCWVNFSYSKMVLNFSHTLIQTKLLLKRGKPKKNHWHHKTKMWWTTREPIHTKNLLKTNILINDFIKSLLFTNDRFLKRSFSTWRLVMSIPMLCHQHEQKFRIQRPFWEIINIHYKHQRPEHSSSSNAIF